MRRKFTGFSGLITVLILFGCVLAACGDSDLQNNTATVPAPSNNNQVGSLPMSATVQSPPTALASPGPTNQVILPNVNVAPDLKPTEAPPVKSELEATDPNTFLLVSGKPQLVEFFAFW